MKKNLEDIFKTEKGTNERKMVHRAIRRELAKFRINNKTSKRNINNKIVLMKEILELIGEESDGYEMAPRSIITTNNKVRGIGAGIINLDTALSCVNRQNGVCNLCKICFSLNHERRFDHVLIHHMKQAVYFHEKEAEDISKDIAWSYFPIIRWNEAGDIEHISQVEKMNEIMRTVNEYDKELFHDKKLFQTYSKSTELAKELDTKYCSVVYSLQDRYGKSYRSFPRPLYDKKNNRFKRNEIHYYLGMDICLGACEDCWACFEKDKHTYKFGCHH